MFRQPANGSPGSLVWSNQKSRQFSERMLTTEYYLFLLPWFTVSGCLATHIHIIWMTRAQYGTFAAIICKTQYSGQTLIFLLLIILMISLEISSLLFIKKRTIKTHIVWFRFARMRLAPCWCPPRARPATWSRWRSAPWRPCSCPGSSRGPSASKCQGRSA